jgi:DNA-binding transcriptional LysR family regulator
MSGAFTVIGKHPDVERAIVETAAQKKKQTILVRMIEKSVQLTALAAHPRLRLTLRQIEVFVATARAGSTRAAADRVARSQSAASAALAELEGHLGMRLFDRVGRRLVLNEPGRELLPVAASLLDQATDLEHFFAAQRAAPLRLAASLSIGEYLLPALLAQWKLEHPGNPVQLMIGNTREVIEAVAGFDADVGFIEGTRTHPRLAVRPWLSDELVVVAAPAHALARGRASLRALREATWALREPGSGTREAAEHWLLERLGPLRVDYELGSPEAIKQLVAAGAALACLPREVVAQDLARGSLVEVRTGWPKATRRLAMVLHRDRQLGRDTGGFVRHCLDAAQPVGVLASGPRARKVAPPDARRSK